jgi:PAS domain S-box-containing protein
MNGAPDGGLDARSGGGEYLSVVDWTGVARRALSRLPQAGVRPDMPAALRKRLVVTNLLALTIAGIVAFWFTVYTIFWIPILARMMLAVVATAAFVPWLNARGHVVMSRLAILGISNVAAAAYALVMGPDAGIIIMFLPLVCAPLALFDLRERALMAVALPFPILLAVGVQWYQVDHAPLSDLPREVIVRASIITLMTATMLVAAMMRFLYTVHASAEARLEHSYRELLRRSDDVVLFVERDGRIADANQEVERQLGYTRAELLGRCIWELDASLSQAEWLVLPAQLEASGPIMLHHNYRRRDGSAFPVEVRIGLVFEGRRPLILAARNISQRNELETRLRVADRLVSVGTLAAGVAHEVNNPLTYLTLNLERVHRRIADSGPALTGEQRREILESLQMALEGSSKVSTIVNDLKTFSRGSEESGAPVDVEKVLASTLKLASLELRDRARVVTEFGGVPAAWGNEARLAQVALNLFLNAAHAMGRGQAHDELRVGTSVTPEGAILITVTDTGQGIAAAHLTRIFDPFFTTKQAEGGTGLGLYVCRSIITEAGGDIGVSSQPGQGTTFRVTLPAAHVARRRSGARFLAVQESEA